MSNIAMNWLPKPEGFRDRLKDLRDNAGENAFAGVVALASHDLDFVQVNSLDRVGTALLSEQNGRGHPTIRLGILGSSTTAHLHAGIRVAGWRRGLRIETYEGDYGQYRQELLNAGSGLHAFKPDAVLIALDAYHLAATPAAGDALDRAVSGLVSLWRVAQERLGATVLQQTALPVFPDLMGENEHRLTGSPAAFIDRLNARLREEADKMPGVHLLAVDRRCRQDGVLAWHDAALWHRSKQEITLHAAPLYGDLVARLLAALRGKTAKALVLDLDNTIWGGVIGDDGLNGIVLGQNSAAGEAFVAMQRHALALSERGIILAVCSKNDEAVALQVFEQHPDMVLRRPHIASFMANWDDKATNIRRIAHALNIGLDALVFVDDNPFERALVRRELPLVSVPEVPEDPALVPQMLSDAGYFESLTVTEDDRGRSAAYQANAAREAFAESATDMDSYLSGLEMRLRWSRLAPVDVARTVQLVNKTNQFNLTTRRITEVEARAAMGDPESFAITLRLLDRFGDNGIIGVVMGRREADDLLLDNWLMSCRVLGRRVEEATLAVVAAEGRAAGAASLLGVYVPSAKNGMVRDHYDRLGFSREHEAPDGSVRYRFPLDGIVAAPDAIIIEDASV